MDDFKGLIFFWVDCFELFLSNKLAISDRKKGSLKIGKCIGIREKISSGCWLMETIKIFEVYKSDGRRNRSIQ